MTFDAGKLWNATVRRQPRIVLCFDCDTSVDDLKLYLTLLFQMANCLLSWYKLKY